MFPRSAFWLAICLLTLFPTMSNVAAQITTYETSTTVRAPARVTVGNSFSVSVIVSFTVPSTINRLFGLETSLSDTDQTSYVDATQILVSGQIKCDIASVGSCLTVEPIFLAWNLQCAGKTSCMDAAVTITFRIKAPSTPKTWHLRAESKFVPVAFTGSTYYPISGAPTGTPSGADFTVAVIAPKDTATLNLNLPPAVLATVDGTRQQNATTKFSLKFGNHTVLVPNLVEFNNSTRLTFTGWKDGERNSNRTLDIRADTTLTARYVKQYQLILSSNLSNSSGWYDEGTTATYSVPSTEPMDGLLGLLGGKWVFQGWYENNTQLVTRAFVGTIPMNTPHHLTARWKGDYTQPSALLGILTIAIIASIIYVTQFSGWRKDSNKDRPNTEPRHTSTYCAQ